MSDTFRKYEVKANSVEDFLNKYSKYNSHWGRGEEYVECRIESHKEYLKKYGYTFITHHDSITGEIVAYFG